MPPSASDAELLVGGLFFVQRLLQQVSGLVVSHGSGPRDERAVGRHLVVLDALRRGDEARVSGRLVEILLR